MAASDSVLVIGSIAIDDIETPAGTFDNTLGGSAAHFACAARFFAPVSVIGCIGEDMPTDLWGVLAGAGIDLSGVRKMAGNTFRWGGRYNDDLSVADTYHLDLGVMQDFEPELTEEKAACRHVFLANAAPSLQIRMQEKVGPEAFVVCDTIRHWIDSEKDEFLEVCRRSSGLILNDEEIQLLTGDTDIVKGAQNVLEQGPSFVVVKKGKQGAVLVCADGVFTVPAFPVPEVRDTTGAGDSFAGGFMGTVCSAGANDTATLKDALAAGIVISSFNVEGIGPQATLSASKQDVQSRMESFRRLLAE